MLDWFRKRLRRTTIERLSLIFELDRTDNGQHIVRISKKRDSQVLPVEDISPLWHYGYQEEEETPSGNIIYVLDEKDRQTLLALRSMNPQVDSKGYLAFDFAPPMLTYLRTKEAVEESDTSKKLKVLNTPLKAVAQIDFDVQQGITVTTGLQDPETNQIRPIDSLPQTTDGKHILVGDTFAPLPSFSAGEATKWWEQPVTRVAIQDIPEFFQRDLVLLKKEFTAVLTDMAGQIQIVDEPFKPVVRIDKGEQGWLNFDVQYKAGAFMLPHEALMKAPTSPYLQIDEKTWIKVDPKTIAKTDRELKKLEAEVTAQGFRAHASEFASLDEFIKSIGGIGKLSAAYQAFLDQLTGFKANEAFRLSAAAELRLEEVGIVLRPYQRAGIHWLDWLYGNHLHGLLADDMGLGKTLQAISVLRRAYEATNSRQHSLILTPKSVLHHWERELKTYFPQLRVYPYHGPDRNRRLLQALEPIVFISTYQTAANDLGHLSKVPFFYVILDEATRIKNPQAQRTQAVKALNGAHRLALSGTPVENRPAEMWSIFDFLMRGHLGRFGTFKRLFEDQIGEGNQHAAKQLGERVRPFMLRRLKEDVAKDLPEKIEMEEWCELTEEQRGLYGGLQDEVKQ